MAFTPDTTYNKHFHNFICKKFNCSCFLNLRIWNKCLVPLSQISTTQHWTCDRPNRQLHVGRSADQRRWNRTLDSGWMDPAHSDVLYTCSYPHFNVSFHTNNNTHRDKSRTDSNCVVSFRLDCFTVLRNGYHFTGNNLHQLTMTQISPVLLKMFHTFLYFHSILFLITFLIQYLS